MSLVEITLHGIALIEAVLSEMKDAHAGKVTPDEAMAKIGELHARLVADRAAADAALAAKFETGGQ